MSTPAGRSPGHAPDRGVPVDLLPAGEEALLVEVADLDDVLALEAPSASVVAARHRARGAPSRTSCPRHAPCCSSPRGDRPRRPRPRRARPRRGGRALPRTGRSATAPPAHGSRSRCATTAPTSTTSPPHRPHAPPRSSPPTRGCRGGSPSAASPPGSPTSSVATRGCGCRAATARDARCPAGSVALAGEFSGVYPRSSPGGWQLLGTTDAVLWDVDRDPPALLTPGHHACASSTSGGRLVTPRSRCSRTGALVLVEDEGRPGSRRVGVGRSGAADRTAYRLGARLVGHPARTGRRSRCSSAGCGARPGPDDRGASPAPRPRRPSTDGRWPTRRSSTCPTGRCSPWGCRPAGCAPTSPSAAASTSNPVLGSRSTDTLSRVGPAPRARVGDVLPVGAPGGAFPARRPRRRPPPRAAPGVSAVLEVLPGPRAAWVGGWGGRPGRPAVGTWMARRRRQRPGRACGSAVPVSSGSTLERRRAAQRGAGAGRRAGAAGRGAGRLPRRPPGDRRLPGRRRCSRHPPPTGRPSCGPATRCGSSPHAADDLPSVDQEPWAVPVDTVASDAILRLTHRHPRHDKAMALAARSPDSTAPLRKPKYSARVLAGEVDAALGRGPRAEQPGCTGPAAARCRRPRPTGSRTRSRGTPRRCRRPWRPGRSARPARGSPAPASRRHRPNAGPTTLAHLAAAGEEVEHARRAAGGRRCRPSRTGSPAGPCRPRRRSPAPPRAGGARRGGAWRSPRARARRSPAASPAADPAWPRSTSRSVVNGSASTTRSRGDVERRPARRERAAAPARPRARAPRRAGGRSARSRPAARSTIRVTSWSLPPRTEYFSSAPLIGERLFWRVPARAGRRSSGPTAGPGPGRTPRPRCDCISFANRLDRPPGTFASSHWSTVMLSSATPAPGVHVS